MTLFPNFRYARVFPAIDLRGGRCVRLVRGRKEREIRYDEDPLLVAQRWAEAGAECLHVIDLGAAFGEPDSAAVILDIAAKVDLPVQTGGGLRDAQRIERLLDGGVGRVLIGTRAFNDPAFLRAMVERHGEHRVVVALDCEGDRIKVSGWEEDSPLAIAEGIDLVRESGARHLLVTATDRDGTLSGPRVELVERVLREGDLRVVAAGGIGDLTHVEQVLELHSSALEGVVVGRALYEGGVDLRAAVELSHQLKRNRDE